MIGMLLIVIFSIFRSADPRNWEWLTGPKKIRKETSPEELVKVQKLQQDLTERVLTKTEHPKEGGANVEKNVAKTQEDGEGKGSTAGLPGPPEYIIPKKVFATIDETTLFIRSREAKAYWTVFGIVRDLRPSSIQQAALKEISYTQIFSDPDFYRGRLIELDGELVQLKRLPAKHNPPEFPIVYEGWMLNLDSGKNPYVFHSLEKPDGLVEGDKLREKIRITGYFFKRYQYPAKSGLTYAAPMFLVKKIQWYPPIKRKAADPRWAPWLLGGLAMIGSALGMIICWFIVQEQRRSDSNFRKFSQLNNPEFDNAAPMISLATESDATESDATDGPASP